MLKQAMCHLVVIWSPNYTIIPSYFLMLSAHIFSLFLHVLIS
ncbi:unnamed protein product, partial [Brassica oleracea]